MKYSGADYYYGTAAETIVSAAKSFTDAGATLSENGTRTADTIPLEIVFPAVPANKYTVTFDTQGHGTAPEAQLVEENAKLTALEENPYDEEFKFCGWYKEAECKNAWDFENDTVTESITLFAKWTEKYEFDIELSEYEFTYDGEAHVPDIIVRDIDGNILKEGVDYYSSVAGGVCSKQIEVGEVEIIVYSENEDYKDTAAYYYIVEDNYDSDDVLSISPAPVDSTPKTGDPTCVGLCILAAFIALAGMVTILIRRKKADR